MELSKNKKPFEGEYWSKIYGSGLDVDGDFNAKLHANYIHSLCTLMDNDVTSIIDFGFGKATLLREFVKKFQPRSVVAIDISKERYAELQKKAWTKKLKMEIHNQSLTEMNFPTLLQKPCTLGISNSVIQYIPDSELASVLEKMASYCKLLYLAVPTKEDYKRLGEDLGFADPYAHIRDGKFYKKLLSKYFRFVSFNLLESKLSPHKKIFEEELYIFT